MRTEGERATIDKVAIAIAEAQHGVRGAILHRAHVRTARGRRQPTSSSTRARSTWQNVLCPQAPGAAAEASVFKFCGR